MYPTAACNLTCSKCPAYIQYMYVCKFLLNKIVIFSYPHLEMGRKKLALSLQVDKNILGKLPVHIALHLIIFHLSFCLPAGAGRRDGTLALCTCAGCPCRVHDITCTPRETESVCRCEQIILVSHALDGVV